jgi:hypothetical protein
MDEYKKRKMSKKIRLISLLFGVVLLLPAMRSASAAQASTFLVDDTYDYSDRDQVDATLVYESKEAYFYFEDQYYTAYTSNQKENVASQIKKLGDEFDSTIYPQVRSIFGSEWNPGIDNDSKMVILFDHLQPNVGGYFNPNDEYPKNSVVEGRSNEREMIYLNPDFLTSGKIEGFLAHEFQHMIYWNEKTRTKGTIDEVWINEARSELASSIIEDMLDKPFTSQTLAVRKRDFLLNYTDSLIDWNNANYDYASVNIFMEYLKDHYGTGIFKLMNGTDKIGAENLDSALRGEDGIGFEELFADWTVANYVNDTDLGVMYGYKNKNLMDSFNVTPTPISDKNNDGVINLTSSLRNWSGDYFKADLTDAVASNPYLKLRFDGEDSGNFSLAYVVNYKDGKKEIGSLSLDARQAGAKNIILSKGAVSSIVFIPSCDKIDTVSTDGKVKSYPFSLDVEFAALGDMLHPDGSLVRVADNDHIYYIDGGKKRWVTDVVTFVASGFDWSKVMVIDDSEMKLYPAGADLKKEVSLLPDGSLLRADGPKIYYIDGGKKRWVTDALTFVNSGFDWNKVIRVSERDLLKYGVGTDLVKNSFADGTLIRGTGPKVYLLAAGKKRWITTAQVFTKNRYDWLSVVTASDAIVSSYPDGLNIE